MPAYDRSNHGGRQSGVGATSKCQGSDNPWELGKVDEVECPR